MVKEIIFLHFLRHLDKRTFDPNQNEVIQKQTEQIVLLDNNTEKLGHNPPKRRKKKKRCYRFTL